MIASLRGTVQAVAGSALVLDVGGVGYLVHVTPEHALAVRHGEVLQLHTALIVREDDMSLFGFEDVEALRLFDLLRGVTGVGPKSALGVLGHMSPEQVALAVQSEDDAAFRKVTGIGPKTAKLIVVSLAGKLVAVAPRATAAVRPGGSAGAEVIIALVGLGWNERAATATVEEVVANHPGERSVSLLLRAALAALGPAASAGAPR